MHEDPIVIEERPCPVCGVNAIGHEFEGDANVLWCEAGHVTIKDPNWPTPESKLVYTFGLPEN